MRNTGYFGRWTGLVVAGIAAAEVIIMSSPFAGFFYASFGFRPLLGFLSDHPGTAWLNGFFLPNAVVTTSSLLEWHRELGLLLLALGLWGFFISAFQVYGNKLFKRGVAKGLLYRISRHPQYLSLAVAGYGMLVIWPRFLLLVLWITMLFLYAGLARFEEQKMRERFGDDYDEFSASRASFVPGSPARRLFEATFGRLQPRWLGWVAAYAACLLIAVGVAFGLRAYSLGQLSTYRAPAANTVALNAWPADESRTALVLESALADERVQAVFEASNGQPILARILPIDYGQKAIFYRKGAAQFSRLEGLTLGRIIRLIQVFVLPTQGYRWGASPLLGHPPGEREVVEVVFSRPEKAYRKTLDLDEVLDVSVRTDPLIVALVRPGRGVRRIIRPQKVWGAGVVMPLF